MCGPVRPVEGACHVADAMSCAHPRQFDPVPDLDVSGLPIPVAPLRDAIGGDTKDSVIPMWTDKFRLGNIENFHIVFRPA